MPPPGLAQPAEEEMTSWDMWPTLKLQQNYCKSARGSVYHSKSQSINGDKPVSYHVSWQLVPREVLHIFMLGVDDFSQFAPVHHLLKHPHFHSLVKFWILGCVVSHDFGNGRTPAESRGQRSAAALRKVWQKPHFDMLTSFDLIFS